MSCKMTYSSILYAGPSLYIVFSLGLHCLIVVLSPQDLKYLQLGQGLGAHSCAGG